MPWVIFSRRQRECSNISNFVDAYEKDRRKRNKIMCTLRWKSGSVFVMIVEKYHTFGGKINGIRLYRKN